MAVQRVRVEDLTSGEIQGLRDTGRDVPAAGFIDLAPQAQPEMVDPKARARAKAAEELRSVGRAAPAVGQLPDLEAELQRGRGTRAEAVPEPTAAEQPPKGKAEAPANCQHCGWDLARPSPAEPTRAEMSDFLRAVMGGEVYTKEVQLFGGAAGVTYRTRTELEDEGVRDALRYLIRSNKVENDRDLVSRVRRIHLAISLQDMQLGKTRVVFENMAAKLEGKIRDGDVFLEEVDSRLSRIPTQLLAALYTAFDEFTASVEVMTSRAQDPVFWIGSVPTL